MKILLTFVIHKLSWFRYEYRYFKATYEYRQAAINKIKKLAKSNHDRYIARLKGVKPKTLAELAKENEQYIQTHPEEFIKQYNQF